MAKHGQFANTMVSAVTGFHGKEGNELRSAEIDPQHWSVLLIDAMESEDRFGRVDGNVVYTGSRTAPVLVVDSPILARDAVGRSTPTWIDPLGQ